MIELFSREPDGLKLSVPSDITPIPIGESIASLSAILLDDDYYQLLLQGKTVIDDYSVLELEYVLIFKMRAWLDLTARKSNGETIDSRDIKKHKNDILRLMMYVMPDKRIETPINIYGDVEEFLAKVSEESVNLKNLGIRSISFKELLIRIEKLFVVV
ncbi:MAG: hypothetical protein N4A76_17420 [Firmicutes bacterium]|jgi:hypothetical protein|nr:hypothetical protein [Bacillota bacterium]